MSPPLLSLPEFLRLHQPRGDVRVDFEGTEVTLTSLNRVYFPADGLTKFDVLRYYTRMWPYLLPHLRGRPAILQRYPRGLAGPKFFQHDLPERPPFVRTQPIETDGGRVIEYAVYEDLPGLLYLVNLGNIEQHAFSARADDVDRPDVLILDLDPGEAPWEDVVTLALLTREVLAERELTGYPKTSGSKGLHIYVPLQQGPSYRTVLAAAREVAESLCERAPDLATLERVPARRGTRIYVDYQVNARGKSVAAPYTVRARPGATVSMPFPWDELGRGLKRTDFTLRSAEEAARRLSPGWDEYLRAPQRLG